MKDIEIERKEDSLTLIVSNFPLERGLYLFAIANLVKGDPLRLSQ